MLHLPATPAHLDVMLMARTVNVSVVALVRLVLDVRCSDGDTYTKRLNKVQCPPRPTSAPLFFSSGVLSIWS